jgi:hypothetical protein
MWPKAESPNDICAVRRGKAVLPPGFGFRVRRPELGVIRIVRDRLVVDGRFDELALKGMQPKKGMKTGARVALGDPVSNAAVLIWRDGVLMDILVGDGRSSELARYLEVLET